MADTYYQLLDVEHDATDEEIRSAVTRQRRIWVRRQSSPDPDRRALAERRVRDIDAAETTLLDPTARQAYDDLLSRAARVDEPGRTEGPDRAADQHRGADAELAAHLDRGEDYLDQGRWRLAQVEFEYVRERAPAESRALQGLGTAHVGAGRVKEGLAILDRLVADRPDDTDVKQALATALYDSALAGLGEVGDSRRRTAPMILSRRQLVLVRTHLRRIRRLSLSDWEVKMYVEDLRDLLAQARKPVWIPSGNLRYYAVPFAAAMLLTFVPTVESLRLLGVFWLVAIVGIYVLRHRQPGWKHQRRTRPTARSRSGRGVFRKGI
jgi:curved DNA-binding protein CbpA